MGEPRELERLNIPYADFYYVKDFIVNGTEIRDQLIRETEWEQVAYEGVDGKMLHERRLSCIFSSNPAYQYSSGVRTSARAFPMALELIRQELNRITQELLEDPTFEYNTCLCAYYQDGNNAIGAHADKEPSLVPGPIAGVSLGAERFFDLELKPPHKDRFHGVRFIADHGVDLSTLDARKAHKVRLTLANGSLIIMGDKSQQNYLHSIPVQKKIKDSRISLTYRRTY